MWRGFSSYSFRHTLPVAAFRTLPKLLQIKWRAISAIGRHALEAIFFWLRISKHSLAKLVEAFQRSLTCTLMFTLPR
jgi:hypothetical protein